MNTSSIIQALAPLVDNERPVRFKASRSKVEQSIVEQFLGDKRLGKLYSRRYLEKSVNRFIDQALAEATTLDAVKAWLDSLVSPELGPITWSVLCAMTGVQVQSPLVVGRSDLEPNNEETLRRIRTDLDPYFAKVPPERKEEREVLLDRFLGQLDTETLVSVRVEALDQTKAQELAESHLEETVSVLRYLAYMQGCHAPIGIKGSMTKVHPSAFLFTSDRKIGASYEWRWTPTRLDPATLRITDEWVQGAQSLGFGSLSRLLTTPHDERSEMEAKFLRALRWFGGALAETDLTDSYLKYAVALEALFGHKDATTNLTTAIAERVAFVRGNNSAPTDRVKIFRETKELYDLRSKIVHHGVEITDPSRVKALCRSVAESVAASLEDNLLDRCKLWSDFVTWVDTRKFS